MSEEFKLMYLNLNQLLQDICKFLKDDVIAGSLSPEAKKQADNLIRRSKVQLQKISSVTEAPNEYLDMTRPVSVKKAVEEPIKTPTEQSEVREEHNGICPYLDLQAKHLPPNEKRGHIKWKTKLFLGLETYRRVYAGIFGEWLLIFNNDKESKPCYNYNLRNHRAQTVITNKQLESSAISFCLINTDTQVKNLFSAQTHKDMLQWIAKINKCHQTTQQIPPEVLVNNKQNENEEYEEEYDIIIESKETIPKGVIAKEEEEDNDFAIYIDLDTRPLQETIPPPREFSKLSPKTSSIRMKAPPPLPLPPLPNRCSTDSTASYDEVQIKRKDSPLPLESDSFSSGEVESIYDEVVAPKTIVMPPPLPREDSVKKKERTSTSKPPLLAKPSIDVKIAKPNFNGKTTKSIMRKASQNSRI